jgi:hypothetical protein
MTWESEFAKFKTSYSLLHLQPRYVFMYIIGSKLSIHEQTYDELIARVDSFLIMDNSNLVMYVVQVPRIVDRIQIK